MISAYENGKNEPSITTLMQMADIFKETLIKSFVYIAQSDFLSGCTNKPQ